MGDTWEKLTGLGSNEGQPRLGRRAGELDCVVAAMPLAWSYTIWRGDELVAGARSGRWTVAGAMEAADARLAELAG